MHSELSPLHREEVERGRERDFRDGESSSFRRLRRLAMRVRQLLSVQNIKDTFTTDVLLRHYDTNKKTFIFVDAHLTGLCAILAQGQSIEQTKAVALASRTTTAAEKNYSQLDLEATAIDFGLRQFRHILAGGPQVTVVTDQQPLQSLWKSKRKPSARIERILLRHQDINHCVVWKKRKRQPGRLHEPTCNTTTQVTSTYCQRNKGTPKTTVPITQHTPLCNCYHQRTPT